MPTSPLGEARTLAPMMRIPVGQRDREAAKGTKTEASHLVQENGGDCTVHGAPQAKGNEAYLSLFQGPGHSPCSPTLFLATLCI